MAWPFLRSHKTGVRLALHIQPNASRTEIIGLYQDRLKIRIQAPPIDGKANTEIIKFLANIFGVPKSSVSLVAGTSGRGKLAEISDLSLTDAEAKIALFL